MKFLKLILMLLEIIKKLIAKIIDSIDKFKVFSLSVV